MRYIHHQPRSAPRRNSAAIIAALVLAMMLSACSGGDPEQGQRKRRERHVNKTQLFTVPKEQVSHIQIVTIQPTSGRAFCA